MNEGKQAAVCPWEWRDPASYGELLIERCLRPLEAARAARGKVPAAVQTEVLGLLQWFFAVDMRERAPTVLVDEAMAVRFHAIVAQIMGHVDRDNIFALDSAIACAEVRHALWAYQKPIAHGAVVVDRLDHERGEARLSYYVHGPRPSEEFIVDGDCTGPTHAKYRACRFFRRTLMEQRIAWVRLDHAAFVQVRLAGRPAEVWIEGPGGARGAKAAAATRLEVATLRQALTPGKGLDRPPMSGNRIGAKARLLRWLATRAFVRRRLQDAWVFADRDENADDNAEHLYRWVRRHHPERKAWFLLRRDSRDWARLAAEGFRLVKPGLFRKLLLLNCSRVVSSHVTLEFGGFSTAVYGDLMRWRYVFLQHGVSKDDISHWLNWRDFDLLLSTSPAEERSIAGDGSPYTFTTREVPLTGLPRYDRLLRWSAAAAEAARNLVLVMPTWRSSLSAGGAIGGEVSQAVAASEYVRRWGALLRNPTLRELVTRHGLELVFIPHTNALPFVQAFGIPEDVEIATETPGGIQSLLCRAAMFVTDYTSVAFDVALLRRPIFYYQFDRDAFYGGDHNWRPGHFDYDSDGFGPVAFEEGDLVRMIEACALRGRTVEERYLARMVEAMPQPAGEICAQVYDIIEGLDRPESSGT